MGITSSLEAAALWTVFEDTVTLRTESVRQCVDLTEWARERVRRSGIVSGMAVVQTEHTTTALVLNENEPLLLDDAGRMLERLVPSDVRYDHDDFSRRASPAPDERVNGAAHCRSLLLGASQTMIVRNGALHLGRWQSLLMVELDGPRARTASILVMGLRSRHA